MCHARNSLDTELAIIAHLGTFGEKSARPDPWDSKVTTAYGNCFHMEVALRGCCRVKAHLLHCEFQFGRLHFTGNTCAQTMPEISGLIGATF